MNHIKLEKLFSSKDGYSFHNNLSSCSYINVIYLFCIIQEISTQTPSATVKQTILSHLSYYGLYPTIHNMSPQKALVQWLAELINLINQHFWRVSSLDDLLPHTFILLFIMHTLLIVLPFHLYFYCVYLIRIVIFF